MLVIEKKMLTVLLFNLCLLLQPVYGNETALLLTNKEQKIEMIQKSDLIFVCEYVNCSQINTQVGIFEIIDQLKGIGFSSKRLYINIPSEGKSDLKPKNKNEKYLIKDAQYKIIKNSENLKSLIGNTTWKNSN